MSPASASPSYNPAEIEAKWQRIWAERGAFKTPTPSTDGPGYFLLAAPPFTSGDVHLGHVRSYSIADAHARFKRACGDSVLFTVGFDAFGQPTEIAARERDLSPSEWVRDCRARMRSQFDRLGFSFDWERSFVTSEPEMYQWSQWLFLTLYDADLIYRAVAYVDWCENCETGLSRTQVEGGRCWRCHGLVSLLRSHQWYLRLSAYNEENERRLPDLRRGWSQTAVAAQQTLLGRCDGVEFDAALHGGKSIVVFTPYPDAVVEGRFIAVSPRHPELLSLVDGTEVGDRTVRLRDSHDEHGRRDPAEASVVETGLWAEVTSIAEPIPVVVSNMVDHRFGATAVLGVPTIDATDAAIASQFATPSPSRRLKRAPLEVRPAVRYRASDFPVSRQRAWGAPIPIVECERCGTVPVRFEDLPVELPPEMRLPERGNALRQDPGFETCDCPRCGGPGRREMDTLDCHFDGLWIHLAAAVERESRSTSLFGNRELRRWIPVAQFVQGGDTGSFVLHERMVAKALRDLGVMDWLAGGEPIERALMHEMVKLDGRKMSKHLGNVVPPEELVERSGADALRLAVLYAAAPDRSMTWDPRVLGHCRAFLDRLWEFAAPRLTAKDGADACRIEESTQMRRRLARWSDIAAERVTGDIDTLEMHRAVRGTMKLLTRIEDFEKAILQQRGALTPRDEEAVIASLLQLLRLIAPVTPHLAEELWHLAGMPQLLVASPWPTVASALSRERDQLIRAQTRVASR